mgnify:CR=1 FL=1
MDADNTANIGADEKAGGKRKKKSLLQVESNLD